MSVPDYVSTGHRLARSYLHTLCHSRSTLVGRPYRSSSSPWSTRASRAFRALCHVTIPLSTRVGGWRTSSAARVGDSGLHLISHVYFAISRRSIVTSLPYLITVSFGSHHAGGVLYLVAPYAQRVAPHITSVLDSAVAPYNTSVPGSA
eukprot:484294-Rhodomonas_salina.2